MIKREPKSAKACACDCCHFRGPGTHDHHGNRQVYLRLGCMECGGIHECNECGEVMPQGHTPGTICDDCAAEGKLAS